MGKNISFLGIIISFNQKKNYYNEAVLLKICYFGWFIISIM